MKQIVICGAGFGGLNCALELNRLMPEASITLIDQSPYHILHAFLYEVAASDEEVTAMADMARSVAVPIKEVLAGTKIVFRQGTIKSVDGAAKAVQLDHGQINFDYLVLALGSGANFYGIPGAAEHSLTLKSLRDALSIRNRVEFLVETARLSATRTKLRFVVAGGGFAGVELAAELKGLLDFLSWKNNYPREFLELLIVEGAPQLMPGLAEKVARDTARRLDELGVKVQTKSLITNVTDSLLEFNTGEKLHYDALFWTAGVKANSVPVTPELVLDRGGRIQTTPYFQAQKQNSIFVVGDQTCFIGTDGRPLPGTALQAIDQGKYVAGAITSFSKNKTPDPYQCKDFGYAVPLGGNWGIAITPHVYWKGYLIGFILKIQWFRYLRRLIGLRQAFKLIWLQKKLYSKND
jgi:NADH dehydrogenase